GSSRSSRVSSSLIRTFRLSRTAWTPPRQATDGVPCSRRRVARSAPCTARRMTHDLGMPTEKPTRREARGGAVATALAGSACAPDSGRAQTSGREESSPMESSTSRMPVVYLPHGGGPWPFVDVGFGDPTEYARLATYLRGLS